MCNTSSSAFFFLVTEGLNCVGHSEEVPDGWKVHRDKTELESAVGENHSLTLNIDTRNERCDRQAPQETLRLKTNKWSRTKLKYKITTRYWSHAWPIREILKDSGVSNDTKDWKVVRGSSAQDAVITSVSTATAGLPQTDILSWQCEGCSGGGTCFPAHPHTSVCQWAQLDWREIGVKTQEQKR